MVRNAIRYISLAALLAALTVSTGCRKKVYENRIQKDTEQPDKVLYDTSIDDIEHGRYERARLTLQTLMNTYDTSEYLAKAKLAMADSWYREGGSRGYSQAEAEYKDFILFYKSMEEAAEAQMKICKMQFDQMDKSDRDPHHALRAQEECKDVLLEFPNSKFAVEAAQYLRDVQEVLADEEHRVQIIYAKKGAFPASANRGQGLTDQFPLYSQSDEALWMLADAYQHLGDRFENQQAAAYARIVQNYPLSPHADSAKLRLQAMNKPVPDVDPVAYARQRYELENRQKRGFLGKVWVPFSSHPDLLFAPRSGAPSMEGLKPTIPVSVPLTAAGTQGTSGAPPTVTLGAPNGELTGVVKSDTTDVDKLQDARLTMAPPGAAAPAPAPDASGAPATGTLKPQLPPAPAADSVAPAAVGPNGKAKTPAQQEAGLKREQAQILKEKQKIQEQQKRQMKIMQEMAKRQQAAGAKKIAQEDADRKKAAKASTRKAPQAAPAAAPTPASAQPKLENPPAAGDSTTAKP